MQTQDAGTKDFIAEYVEQARDTFTLQKGEKLVAEVLPYPSSKEGFTLSRRRGQRILKATSMRSLIQGHYTAQRLPVDTLTFSREKSFVAAVKVTKGAVDQASALRAAELGYTSLIVGLDQQVDFAACDVLGLDVYLHLAVEVGEEEKILPSPMNPVFKERLLQAAEASHPYSGIYWESLVVPERCPQHPDLHKLTECDHLLAEMKFWEGVIQPLQSVIFDIPHNPFLDPSRVEEYVKTLSIEASPRTLIHSKQCPDLHLVNTLSAVNTTGVDEGEGLWPTLSLQPLDRSLSSLQRSRSRGMISTLRELPSRQELLDCRIFSFNMSLGCGSSLRSLIESWFETQPDACCFSEFDELFYRVEMITLDLSRILHSIKHPHHPVPFKDNKRVVSSLIHQIDQLRSLPCACMFVSNLRRVFCIDARRILYAFVQKFHVAYSFVLEGEDREQGCWTALGDERQGLSALVEILDEPIRIE